MHYGKVRLLLQNYMKSLVKVTKKYSISNLTGKFISVHQKMIHRPHYEIKKVGEVHQFDLLFMPGDIV